MADVGQIDTTTESQTNPFPLSATKRVVVVTLEQFRAHLAQLAHDSGGKAELGRRLGVTGEFVGYVIKGQRKPGKKLFKAIGARPRLMIEIDVEVE